MQRDKKVRAGGLRFVVLTGVGAAATRGEVPLPVVEAAFRAVGAA
jgi:3-dehydroquinate synthase